MDAQHLGEFEKSAIFHTISQPQIQYIINQLVGAVFQPIAIDARGLGLDSQAGQITTQCCQPLWCFFGIVSPNARQWIRITPLVTSFGKMLQV